MLTGLAARRGQPVTLSVTTAGTANVDGTVSGQTTTNMAVQAVVSKGKVEMVDGVAVQPSDLVLMVPAPLSTPPVAGGMTRATVDGVARMVEAIETRRDRGEIGGYVLLLRGAA